MAGILAKQGYKIISDEDKRDEADLWLLVRLLLSC